MYSSRKNNRQLLAEVAVAYSTMALRARWQGGQLIMCGRFTRQSPIKVLATFFDCPPLQEAPPRYNVALPQQVLAVRRLPCSCPDQRRLSSTGSSPAASRWTRLCLGDVDVPIAGDTFRTLLGTLAPPVPSRDHKRGPLLFGATGTALIKEVTLMMMMQ